MLLLQVAVLIRVGPEPELPLTLLGLSRSAGPLGSAGFGPRAPSRCRWGHHGLPGPASSTHDPLSVEIYHTTFDWPPETETQDRLVIPEGISEVETAQKLLDYHRGIIRILPSYPKILKTISADQPCVDVFCQGEPPGPLVTSASPL